MSRRKADPQRGVRPVDQMKFVAHQVRIVERSIEDAYEGMILVLQVIPDDLVGSHAFRLRAIRLKRSVYDLWVSLNQMCIDMGLPHTLASKGGD